MAGTCWAWQWVVLTLGIAGCGPPLTSGGRPEKTPPIIKIRTRHWRGWRRCSALGSGSSSCWPRARRELVRRSGSARSASGRRTSSGCGSTARGVRGVSGSVTGQTTCRWRVAPPAPRTSLPSAPRARAAAAADRPGPSPPVHQTLMYTTSSEAKLSKL